VLHLQRTYQVEIDDVMRVARTIFELACDDQPGSGWVIHEQRHGDINKITLAMSAEAVDWTEDAAGFRTARAAITADVAGDGTLVSIFVKPEFVANPNLDDEEVAEERGTDETTAYEMLGRLSGALFRVLRKIEQARLAGPEVEGLGG
jgi:hypothetical protein